MKQITGYHFTANTLRNGQLIPKIGVWLRHEGKIDPCVSGLHASEHPFDALTYAPGNLLHKVILRGELKTHGDNGTIDKYVGRERKILASIDAQNLLFDFARWNALQVVHLWDCPKIVKDFLETGDESLRDSAWAAARDAAWAAARAAARAATWDAARDAAWDAARAATWDAARDAARDAFTEKVRAHFSEMVEEAFKKAREK